MISTEEYIKRCPIKECNPKGLSREYQHLCGKENCMIRKGYLQGRADERKDFEDIVMGLSKEDARRIRKDTIDETINRLKQITNKDVVIIEKANLDDIARELKEQI